ncbi:MAG TPA: LytTR family DNA-binding domain-containing protein [Chitinophagales bacterium]|nr:LytTR family DNA-binding domain-containing protein [Chitinophagales bacterium]
MKVVIIEDEPLVAKNLIRMIKQIEPAAEVINSLDSVESAVKWVKENQQPDLFFMDIQLSDGISFDIFDKVKIEKPVVFTTAYNEYAIRAFKVNSIDYLLKPIDKDQLQLAIDKFKKYHGQSNVTGSEQLQSFVSSYGKAELPKYKERFLAHYKAGIVPLPEAKVAYFVKDTIIYLVTTDNEKLVTDYNTIDEIEEVVNPKKFFRANRQMIIHIDQIDTYKKHDTGKIEVHLKCDKNARADVSREKANEFVNWLDQ